MTKGALALLLTLVAACPSWGQSPDFDLDGLTQYEAGQPVSGRYQLLMKPEYHTTVDAGAPNLDELQLAWFDRWLKNEPTGIDGTATPLHIVQPGGARVDAAHFPHLEDPDGLSQLLREFVQSTQPGLIEDSDWGELLARSSRRRRRLGDAAA